MSPVFWLILSRLPIECRDIPHGPRDSKADGADRSRL
jgi:hypothetical protein